jgi:hypothetical protein
MTNKLAKVASQERVTLVKVASMRRIRTLHDGVGLKM